MPFRCIYFYHIISIVRLRQLSSILPVYFCFVFRCLFCIRLTSCSYERMSYLSLFLWIIITFEVILRLLLIMMVMMLFDGFLFFYRHRYWQRHFLYDGFGVHVCVMLDGHMYANPMAEREAERRDVRCEDRNENKLKKRLLECKYLHFPTLL